MTTKNNSKTLYYLACITTTFLSLLIFLSLVTYDTNDNSLFQYDSSVKINNNILGVSGAVVSDLLIKTFGIASFIIPVVLGYWAFSLISKKRAYFSGDVIILSCELRSLIKVSLKKLSCKFGVYADIVFLFFLRFVQICNYLDKSLFFCIFICTNKKF